MDKPPVERETYESPGRQAAQVRQDSAFPPSITTVGLPSLGLTALQSAVAAAVASGATGIEAAAVVGPPSDTADPGLAALRDLSGAGILVLRATPSGERTPTLST